MPEKDSRLTEIYTAAGAALIIFLLVFAVWGVFGIINKFKEGRYIGQGSQYQNTIMVSGLGKTLAKPDIGQVNLTVLSPASTVAQAQKDNTDKMNSIIKAMKDLGIDENDLKTKNYSIYPRYNYSGGRSTIIGYEVSQTLEVRIRALEKASDILSKATEMGANQVSSLVFTFDDPEKLKDDARKEAVENAKIKAQGLARELGVSLGKVTSFSETSSGQPVVPLYEKALSSSDGIGGAAPDIQTGQNEIQVNVSVSYEIY